jgi:hypothetical protein
MADAKQLKVAGGFALGAAVLIAVAITVHPDGLNAPAWVAYVAAASFGLAGLSALAQAFRRISLAYGLVCWLLCALLLIELWIAFGPGARQCTIRVPGLASLPADLGCRSVFGLGALLVGVMLVLAIRGWRSLRSEG